MDYRVFFDLHSIKYQEGLTDEEIGQIEKIYNIFFPKELRQMFIQALPISDGFYNWRDLSEKNVKYISQCISRPFVDFYNDAAAVYWNDTWGEEPDSNEIEEIVRDKLTKAPKLIPVYAHRYIAMVNGEKSPIFSVHGIDIIVYGENLDDYLKVEFGEKYQSSIDFSSIRDVPFWSELI